MGKKKFINKKKSATFTLVYRDSAAEVEGTGSVRQFTRVDGGDNHVPGFSEDDARFLDAAEEVDEEEFDDLEDSKFADAEEDSGDEGEEVVQRSYRQRASNPSEKRSAGLSESARRDLIELGFPDDGYDYNQHMRLVGSSVGSFVPTTKQPLPPRADVKAYDASKVDLQTVQSKKADEFTELVRSRTRLMKNTSSHGGGLDGDVIAALENSDGSQFDSADELDDEFVVLASTGGEGLLSGLLDDLAITSRPVAGQALPQHRLEVSSDEQEFDDEEDEDDVPAHSSREKPTRLLDEQFESLAVNEYDDFDNSDLDEDDPLARGNADISQFSSVLMDFLNDEDISSEKYEAISESNRNPATFDRTNVFVGGIAEGGTGANTIRKGLDDPVLKKTLELGGYVSENEVIGLVESEDDAEEWDCETVVSTFSNLDNHPARIGAQGKPRLRSKLQDVETNNVIRLGGRQHLPLDILPGKMVHGKKQAEKPAKKDAIVFGSRAGETLEDKKARKALIKEHRKEARLAKKTLKLCFREDSQRAQRGAATMGPNAIHLP